MTWVIALGVVVVLLVIVALDDEGDSDDWRTREWRADQQRAERQRQLASFQGKAAKGFSDARKVERDHLQAVSKTGSRP